MYHTEISLTIYGLYKKNVCYNIDIITRNGLLYLWLVYNDVTSFPGLFRAEVVSSPDATVPE